MSCKLGSRCSTFSLCSYWCPLATIGGGRKQGTPPNAAVSAVVCDRPGRPLAGCRIFVGAEGATGGSGHLQRETPYEVDVNALEVRPLRGAVQLPPREFRHRNTYALRTHPHSALQGHCSGSWANQVRPAQPPASARYTEDAAVRRNDAGLGVRVDGDKVGSQLASSSAAARCSSGSQTRPADAARGRGSLLMFSAAKLDTRKGRRGAAAPWAKWGRRLRMDCRSFRPRQKSWEVTISKLFEQVP